MVRKRKRKAKFPLGFAAAENRLDEGVSRLLMPAGDLASEFDSRLRSVLGSQISGPQTVAAMSRSKLSRSLEQRLDKPQKLLEGLTASIRQQVVNGFTAAIENVNASGLLAKSPAMPSVTPSVAGLPVGAADSIQAAAAAGIDATTVSSQPVGGSFPPGPIVPPGFLIGPNEAGCLIQSRDAIWETLCGRRDVDSTCRLILNACAENPEFGAAVCAQLRANLAAGVKPPQGCGEVARPPLPPPTPPLDEPPVPGEEEPPPEPLPPEEIPTHCGLFVDCESRELYFVKPGESLHNENDKAAGSSVDVCLLEQTVEDLCRVPPPPPEPVPCGLYLDCRTRQLYTVPDGGQPRSSDDRIVDGTIPSQSELETECVFSCSREPEPEPEPEETPTAEPPTDEEPAEEPPPARARQDRVAACKDLPFTGVFHDFSLDEIFGFEIPEQGGLFAALNLFGFTPNQVREFLAFLMSAALTDITRGSVAQGAAATRLAGCFSPETISLMTTGTVLGLAHQWLGAPNANLVTGVQNQINFNCPTDVPSPGEALQAFLADAIDEETWECWTRAGNIWFPAARKLVDVGRSKPNEAETLSLLRRKVFSRKEFDDGMRRIGWLPGFDLAAWEKAQDPLTGPADLVQMRRREIIDEDDYSKRMDSLGFSENQKSEFFELSKQFPGIGELIQFMVRDADDAVIVERFGLDSQFDRKFGGELRELAEQTAVPERIMRLAWRAHWDIPGPNALFDMFHRSRVLPDGDPRKATRQDVEAALIQQDILPFWIPKILNTSFTLLTRVDIRRFFELGVISREAVVDEFVRRGYSDEDSDRQAEFADKNLTRKIRNSPVVKSYARGEIPEADLRVELQRLGARPAAEQEGVDAGKRLLSIDTRKKCLRSLRKRFLLGDFDVLEARDLVIGLGLDADQAQVIVNGWACERDHRDKLASANVLCGWLERGAITAGEMVERLIRLGWDDQDALRLLTDCQARIQLKVTKEQKRRLDAALKEAEKNTKERDRMLKQITRDNEAARREREKRRSATSQREQITLEIAGRVMPEDGDISTVQGDVVRAIRRFRSRFLLDFDTVLEIGAEVAQRAGVAGDFDGWATETSEVLAGYPALPASQSLQDVSP